MIGKRSMPDGAWESYELASTTGNPMVSPTVDDGHNSLAVALDSDGYFHVSGNMHNFALRYVRSTAPSNITAWTAPAMIGTNEYSVTYPQFITAGDGSLLFLHRTGGAGNGDSYLNRYNVTTMTWARVSKLLSGTGFDPPSRATTTRRCSPRTEPSACSSSGVRPRTSVAPRHHLHPVEGPWHHVEEHRRHRADPAYLPARLDRRRWLTRPHRVPTRHVDARRTHQPGRYGH
jgi:hypothetical protein